MNETRKAEIRHAVRKTILWALKNDLAGDEQVMKEAWEECRGKEELAVAEAELKAVIEAIGQMPW